MGGDGEEKDKEDREKGPIFSDTVKEDNLEILFRLTGIDPDRVLRAKPGDNATITCTAYSKYFLSTKLSIRVSFNFTLLFPFYRCPD